MIPGEGFKYVSIFRTAAHTCHKQHPIQTTTISNLKQLSFSDLIHPQMYVCELDKIFATFDVCAVKL